MIDIYRFYQQHTAPLSIIQAMGWAQWSRTFYKEMLGGIMVTAAPIHRLAGVSAALSVCSSRVQRGTVTFIFVSLCFPFQDHLLVHKRQGWFCIALIVSHKRHSIKNIETKNKQANKSRKVVNISFNQRSVPSPRDGLHRWLAIYLFAKPESKW